MNNQYFRNLQKLLKVSATNLDETIEITYQFCIVLSKILGMYWTVYHAAMIQTTNSCTLSSAMIEFLNFTFHFKYFPQATGSRASEANAPTATTPEYVCLPGQGTKRRGEGILRMEDAGTWKKRDTNSQDSNITYILIRPRPYSPELFNKKAHRCGPGGSMLACHAAGPGSIPGRDKFPG